MIARVWHGVTAVEKSEEYLDYLNETGVPEYRATEGNRGTGACMSCAGSKKIRHTS
ncbi:MAG: hypothetical protein WKF95_12835 [Rubrobacter sp.]